MQYFCIPISGKMDMDIISQIRAATRQVLQEQFSLAPEAGEVPVNETRPEFEGDYTVVLFSFLKPLKKLTDALGKPLHYTINKTMMRVELPAVLKPGQKFIFKIDCPSSRITPDS